MYKAKSTAKSNICSKSFKILKHLNIVIVFLQVNVTIQKIPKEAVYKSGSIRIKGNPEDFIKLKQDSNGNLVSKRDEFTSMMKNFLNASAFDVFTIIPSGSVEEPSTDIRFVPKKIP